VELLARDDGEEDCGRRLVLHAEHRALHAHLGLLHLARRRGSERVSQQCLNGHIFDAVEAYNRSCFSGCGPTRNTTSDCWISCFYDGVLGTEVLTGGSITGIPLEQLDHAWLQSFRSDDPHAGGCPPIALPPPVNCFEKFKDRDSCDSNPQCS
jgi:hypothetical protein